MATRGDSGQLFALLREASRDGARVGQTFALVSVLSIVGGVGLVVLTETFQFDAETLRTYRTFAGGLVGYGLPALLYGMTIAANESGNGRTADVSVVGVLLSVLAVVAFLLTYPERWAGAGAAGYVVPTLAVYGLGVLFCSAAAGGAILAGRDAADESDDGSPPTHPDAADESDDRSSPTHPDTDDETGFIWGSPPES